MRIIAIFSKLLVLNEYRYTVSFFTHEVLRATTTHMVHLHSKEVRPIFRLGFEVLDLDLQLDLI